LASKSKTKGKGFEREVCNILSKIYDDNFERVPHSGAFVGGMNAIRKSTLTENQIKAFKGDIIPPDHWNYFNCECKNYADFPFHHLIQEKPIPLLEQWLEQTLDAHDENDLDILFMKFNRKGIYLAFPSNLDRFLFTARRVTYGSQQYGSWTITFWEDFANNKDNLETLEKFAINGANIDPR
jgi:hypothetical protein